MFGIYHRMRFRCAFSLYSSNINSAISFFFLSISDFLAYYYMGDRVIEHLRVRFVRPCSTV